MKPLVEDPEGYEETLRSRLNLVPYRDWEYKTKDDFEDPNKGFSYETYSGSRGSLENVGLQVDLDSDEYIDYADDGCFDFSHAALKNSYGYNKDSSLRNGYGDNTDVAYVSSGIRNQLLQTPYTEFCNYDSAPNGVDKTVSSEENIRMKTSSPTHHMHHHHHHHQHRPATARELPPNPLDPKNYNLYERNRRPVSAPQPHRRPVSAPNYTPQPHQISSIFSFRPEDIPIQQSYDLTKLKRSNLRTSDQLLPDPKDSRMDLLMIDRPFPAEHPYTSHIPRVAMFPKFAESPKDPKRGVDARKLVPKDAEMPANAYDVTIVHKTKGQGDRHEIQDLPSESHKRALTWPEPEFNQLVKSGHSGRQQFYPTPIKYLVPNLEKRRPDQQICERTANALRNVERSHWKTTYDLENTGHGPSNPLALDNYREKVVKFKATGDIDDELYPRSVPTFDPPRPVEGRIGRQINPRPSPQVNADDFGDKYTWNTNYKRKMTLREKEENRLMNGTAYKNMPEDMDDRKYGSQQWLAMEKDLHPERQRHLLNEQRETHAREDIDHHNAKTDDVNGIKNPLDELRHQEKDRFQQIEASNRWKLLELQKPSHDIQALNEKYKTTSEKERPGVFYKHEGTYQAERAGMYQTSYLPEKLSARLDDAYETGVRPSMFDTSASHVDAINQSSSLSAQMNVTNSFNAMNLYNEPNSLISGRQEPEEVLAPLAKQTFLQKQHLKPDLTDVDVKTVENGVINTESTHGTSYNKPKFLQEYSLHPFARHEPLVVMSTANQSLHNVKAHASTKRPKTVQFTENVTIATGAGGEPIRLSSAPMSGSVNQPVSEVQYTSSQAKFDPRNTLSDSQLNNDVIPASDKPVVALFNGTWPMPSLRATDEQNQRTSRMRGSYDRTIVQDQFAESRGKAVSEDRSEFKSAYQAQFGSGAPPYDMSFKHDKRFDWNPASGTPRPQTSLLKIQDSFSKSRAHRKFHHSFPEQNPDLRENIIKGRQHEFNGYNTMQLRGNGGPIEVA
ncbi:uncharacterized protein LOC141907550 [Tubulanus polymorphus]|uniref:uncharacterized protein LOC141907550 n=1 Tax=Tubulanus polymorphus TaxID=672921 RepID=UPI003DA491E1